MRRLLPRPRILAGLLLLGVLLAALAVAISPQILIIDSGTPTADVMVVLGGGLNERPERAAQLFREGAAPKILITGFGDSAATSLFLEQNGVPVAAITREDQARNTLENAKYSIPLLQQMNAHRVTIVTSWYHTRRALACFEHFAPDLQFYSRPSYLGRPHRDWLSHGIIHLTLNEYLKLPAYWLRYGINPSP